MSDDGVIDRERRSMIVLRKNSDGIDVGLMRISVRSLRPEEE